MIRALLFVIALAASAFCGPGIVHAQATPVSYAGLSVLNDIINSTPGVTTVTVGGAATESAAATETVTTAAGLRIPIAETAAATITGSRLAGLAAGAMKLGSWIGIAAVVLPMISQATGIVVCPPPQFFCKPDPAGPAQLNVQGHYINSSNLNTTICRYASNNCSNIDATNAYCNNTTWTPYTSGGDPNPNYDSYNKQYSYYFQCKAGDAIHNVYSPQQTACPTGYTLYNNECVISGTPIPLVDAPASDIQAALTPKLSDAANMKALADSARKASIAMFDNTSPVTVTAPSVTSQPVTTTSTIYNPDGTTSTKVVTVQSTVNPAISGTTFGDTKVTYPTTTTTTTTTTNNTTNETSTSTTTTNEYATPDAPGKLDLPTDYNRENTQKQIEQDLNTDAAPNLPDQTKVITAAKSDNDANLSAQRKDAQDQFEPSHSLWWYFTWTPPSATCTPFQLTVNGSYVSSLDVCDTVNNLQDVLGWLMALGSAYSVWGQLFKGERDA